ncbi:MAG TPA: hypothetical protein VLG12_02805 [Candidatus Saccharimonadales bacterium]|nr:hypothetical protein [Candidatus Saccharimonadales bacterium]
MNEYVPQNINEASPQNSSETFHPQTPLKIGNIEYALGEYDDWSGKKLPVISVSTTSIEGSQRTVTAILSSVEAFPIPDASVNPKTIQHMIDSMHKQLADPATDFTDYYDCPSETIHDSQERLILGLEASGPTSLGVFFNRRGDQFNASLITTSIPIANQRKRIIYQHINALEDPTISIKPDPLSLTLQTTSSEEFLQYLHEIDEHYGTRFLPDGTTAAFEKILDRLAHPVYIDSDRFTPERLTLVNTLAATMRNLSVINPVLERTILDQISRSIHSKCCSIKC